jgi:hypothetical protein
MNICVDGADAGSAPDERANRRSAVVPTSKDEPTDPSVASAVNFFINPMKFFVSRGIDIGKLANVNDVKTLVKTLQPAMSPEIAKASGELMNFANLMGVDLSSNNPLFDQIRGALAEGIKGYLQVKGENE